VSAKGGRREGAGRPARHTAKRNNIMLETWAWEKLGQDYGKQIEELIMATMTDGEKEQAARERIGEMNFSDGQLDFIWSDWPNWNEHVEWLLTASKKEIVDWFEAGQ
jgi:hypothetical protein